MTDTITPGTRLRCSWEVHAGLIPGSPIPEHTKRWHLTSEQWQKEIDMTEEQFKELHPDGQSSFQKYQSAAYEYAHSLTDPRGMNWVRVEWIWY